MEKTIKLANGVQMPRLGLGVFRAEEGAEVEQAIAWALEAGYRSIDTAKIYRNEKSVGKAIKRANIDRSELFITTKIWNDDQGYESTLFHFENSLAAVQLDYIDLYLIHWPVAGLYKETWRALEKLYNDGLVRAIGVSNFHEHHLDDLLTTAEITPMVNQVELHPYLNQAPLRAYCQTKGIAVEAWAPIARGKLMEEPILVKIAQAHQKTVAQIILRWDIQHDIITIPKSVTESRIIENINVFDFELTEVEMNQIDALNRDERYGTNPDTFDTK